MSCLRRLEGIFGCLVLCGHRGCEFLRFGCALRQFGLGLVLTSSFRSCVARSNICAARCRGSRSGFGSRVDFSLADGGETGLRLKA